VGHFQAEATPFCDGPKDVSGAESICKHRKASHPLEKLEWGVLAVPLQNFLHRKWEGMTHYKISIHGYQTG
jgi:hypothetical protein